MKKRLIAISGLPRAGSSLLQNLLRQNKDRFYASPTSAMLDILFSIRNHYDNYEENKANPHPTRKMSILRGIVDAYYEDIPQPIIFDKSRGFTEYAEFVSEIIEEPLKIICPVRNLPDVLASMEKLVRETSKFRQPAVEQVDYFAAQSLEGRLNIYLRGSQPIGLAINRISHAIKIGWHKHMYFLEYEKFTKNPRQTLKEIHDFIGEPYFNYDFNNVVQTIHENDEVYGLTNDLHDIRSKIEFKPSDAVEILGKDLTEKYNIKYY